MLISRRVAQLLLRVLPVLVTAVLLALVLRSSSLDKFFDLWRHFNAGYLEASAALMIITIAAGAIALLVLFELKGLPAWWARFTVDYFYVQALCQLTPAQAGEVALPYIAGRGRFAPGEIAASLVIQRMISVGIVVLVALSGARQWADPPVLWGASAMVLLSCLAAIVMIRHSDFRNWANELVNHRLGPILYGFYDTLTGVFRNRRGRLLVHIILMVGRFVAGAAAFYAMLLAFGVAVPFWEYAALSAGTTLVVLVPVSINGVGVTEGIFVAALASYGNGTEQILAACLAGRVLTILILLAGASAFWFLRRRDQTSKCQPNASD